MKPQTLRIWGSLLLALSARATIGCSSNDSGPSATAGASGTGGGTSDSGSGGTSDSGSGGTSDSGSVTMPLNGCDSTTAVDMTTAATPTIDFPASGIVYTPKCIMVKVGATVSFVGDLAAHPLRGGTASSSTMTPDPASPIPATDSGSSVMVKFSSAGSYGFYCAVHGTLGMKGAVFVQ